MIIISDSSLWSNTWCRYVSPFPGSTRLPCWFRALSTRRNSDWKRQRLHLSSQNYLISSCIQDGSRCVLFIVTETLVCVFVCVFVCVYLACLVVEYCKRWLFNYILNAFYFLSRWWEWWDSLVPFTGWHGFWRPSPRCPLPWQYWPSCWNTAPSWSTVTRWSSLSSWRCLPWQR